LREHQQPRLVTLYTFERPMQVSEKLAQIGAHLKSQHFDLQG